jgi:hypothetical protein
VARASSGESIQAQQFQPGQFHQDHNIRTPYMASQVYHGLAVNIRDANSGNPHPATVTEGGENFSPFFPKQLTNF